MVLQPFRSVHRKRGCLLLLMALAMLLVKYLWSLQEARSADQQKLASHRHEEPTILWWTHMSPGYGSVRYCGMRLCRFTTDRSKLNEAAAVLFYASQLSEDDMPLPRRSPQHLWALLHEESPRNLAIIRNAAVLRHFNITSTFSRHSDFPLTTQYLESREALTTSRYMVPIGQKNLFRKQADGRQGLAAVVFLQSDCDTMSRRDEYVRQLMQHIPVDSYGLCLHNRDLPSSLQTDYLNKLYSPELLHFLGKYKFILSYENGICDDYITEKFWRPLIVGSIPVYFGSPSIDDWQPNPKSVIHISNFGSPKSLADYLHQLDRNDVEYNSYLNHKFDQVRPITNERLLKDLADREYSTTVEGEGIFGGFECSVCRQLYDLPRGLRKTATVAHYNCPMPVQHPPMEIGIVKEIENDWQGIMKTGECVAVVLDKLWQRNRNYTKDDINDELEKSFSSGICS